MVSSCSSVGFLFVVVAAACVAAGGGEVCEDWGRVEYNSTGVERDNDDQ